MARAGDSLSANDLKRNFADSPPALTDAEALIEAARCLHCFDAPCTRACPTLIDVPKFIRQIQHKNPIGAAQTILDANILGGSCARACPTDVLCEGACVDALRTHRPIPIGRLQRYACDAASAKGERFFHPGTPTGRKVAIIGSGPAGMTCAHELRKRGHGVVVFESRDVPGGLPSHGIAAYKIKRDFALSEIEMLQQLGIEIRLNHPVSSDELNRLIAEYDAVFLGMGLGKSPPFTIPGHDLQGVWDALDFIAQTHNKPLVECQVGRRVMVIGAGNTAMDAAIAAVRLGAPEVTIVYRKGPESMPAYGHEFDRAKADGVRFRWNVQPIRITGKTAVQGIDLACTTNLDSKRDVPAAPTSHVPADMVVLALGQSPVDGLDGLKINHGRIAIDPTTGATSIPRVFAGGDCVRIGGELVHAVQDGKIAAAGIHALLERNESE
jgi:glutamate synthase (NADPH/NADH) small chain